MNDSPSSCNTFLIELPIYSLLYYGNFLYILDITLLSNVLFETIVYILGLLVWCFYEIPECENEWVSVYLFLMTFHDGLFFFCYFHSGLFFF